MPTRKLLTVIAVTPLVLGVATADAATKPPAKKPVCKLVKDAANDGTGTGTGVAGPNDPNLDILSADIATNAKTLTAAVRLSAVDGTGNSSPTGRAYTVTFTVAGATKTLRALVGPTGEVWPGGAGTGKVDTKTKEIRFSVPLSSLGVPVKANTKFTGLSASSWRWGASASLSLGLVDSAAGTTPYLSAWPSCVRVGA